MQGRLREKTKKMSKTKARSNRDKLNMLVEVASKGQFKSKTKSKAIKGKNRRIKFTDKRSTGMLYEVIPWDYVVEEVNKGSLRLPKGEVLLLV